MQCRVQYQHVSQSQVGMNDLYHMKTNLIMLGEKRMGLTNSLYNASTYSFNCSNDVEVRAFIAFNVDLAVVLIISVCLREIQLRSIVTPSVFLSVLTGIE